MAITELQDHPLHSQYLGAPSIIGTPKKHHFNPLLDRFLSKLSGWKSRLLSFAGRRILVRHVLSSLATHIALIFPIPKSVSSTMESFMRNFLWSAGPSKQKRNQIGWEVLCLPIKEGGLGIRRINEQNEASFIKLAWLVASSNSLWANWMANRYLRNSAVWSPSSSKTGSCIWHKIRNSGHHIHLGCKWIIGDGKSAEPWYDSWAKDETLASLYTPFPFLANEHPHHLWDDSTWVIPTNIPAAAAISLRYALTTLSLDEHSANRIVWKAHPHKGLSLKEAGI